MKKYDMSIIDLSEIENVTTDIAKLQKATDRLKELKMLDEKSNANIPEIRKLAESITKPLLGKLSSRIRRKTNGMMEIYENINSLFKRGEITAVYLYIAFIYGYLQWRVPEAVGLLPADDKALGVFANEFKKCFSEYINNLQKEE